MASFCMTVVLLLSSVVWAPAAGAEGETISLAEADIKFIEVCYYDGSRKKPDMTVTVQGNTLEEKRDYSVSYEDNLDAGTATLTVTGIGKYSGTQTKKFTIHPREISADDLKIEHGYIRAYNESREAFPEIEADSNKVFRQDNVTVVCKRAEFDTPFVGNQKKVTVYEVAFEGEKKGNYALKEETFNLTDNTATITAVEPKLEKSASLAKGQSLDLKQLISNTWKGEVSFSFDIGEESLNCSLTEDGILTAGQETGTVRILANMQPLDVNGDDVPEYTSGIGYLNLKIVEKETQGAFEVIGPERVTYGTSNSFYTVGGSGSGGVTFSIQEEIGTGEADIDPKTGKLTPEKVGTVYVRATKEGDERYQTVESDPVPVTILPAPPHHPSQRQNRPHWRCHPHPHGGGLHRHRSGGVGYPGPGPQPHLCVHPGHEQNRSGGHPGFRGGHPQWELRSQHHVPPRGAHHPGDPHLYCHSANGGERDDHRRQGHRPGGGHRHPHRPPGRGICIAVPHRDLRCRSAGHGAAPGEGGGDLHLCHARRGRHRHRNLRPGRGGRGTLAALPLYRCAGDHVVL